MSRMVSSEVPDTMSVEEFIDTKISQLEKENKKYKDFLKLAKRAKVVEFGITYAVMGTINANTKEIKKLQNLKERI